MVRRTKLGLGALAALLGLAACVTYALVVVPPSDPAKAAVGAPAPGLALASTAGGTATLADLVKDRRAAVLVFYRGHW